MALSVNDMVQVVFAGGGLDISNTLLSSDAIRIASFAGENGAPIIFRQTSHWTTQEMVQIASSGKGRVQFVI